MKKSWKIVLISIIGLVLLAGAGLFGWKIYQNNLVVTTITLDINPSIEIRLNKNDKVIKIIALNDDATKLLDNNSLKGKSLQESINVISDKLIENNYMANDYNLILVNVNGKSLENEVSSLFTENLKSKNIECNIIIQTIDEESAKKAKENDITPSKASYIDEIVKENEDLNFDELKDKSINEINEVIIQKEEAKKAEEQKKIDEVKKAEEQKKIDEAKKLEEQQKKATAKTNTSTSSSPRKGSFAKCEQIKANLTNDDATKLAFNSIGLEPSIWYTYQTIASIYNEVCSYETKLVYQKTLYTFYYNIVDGSFVHKSQIPWLAGTYEDVVEILNNYFATTYGATSDQVLVRDSSGTINEPTKEGHVEYNGKSYSFIIDQKTGAIKSIK